METKQINVFSSELASDLFNEVINLTMAPTPAEQHLKAANVVKCIDLLHQLLEEESISGDISYEIDTVKEVFIDDISNGELTEEEAYQEAMTELWIHAKDIRLTVIDFQLQEIDEKIKQNKYSVSALKRKRDVLKKYSSIRYA